MNLKSIEIQNFKSTSFLKLGFEEITLIFGDNGSGKSTIIDALKLCLADKTNENLSEYIKRGESYFLIDFAFEENNTEYHYEYRYGSSGYKKLTYEDNGKQIVLKGGDCVDHIAKFINSDLLLYSSISIFLSLSVNELYQRLAENLL